MRTVIASGAASSDMPGKPFFEWVEQEGVDPNMSYVAGPWLAQYTAAEYKTVRCKRCGELFSHEGPLRYRG